MCVYVRVTEQNAKRYEVPFEVFERSFAKDELALFLVKAARKLDIELITNGAEIGLFRCGEDEVSPDDFFNEILAEMEYASRSRKRRELEGTEESGGRKRRLGASQRAHAIV